MILEGPDILGMNPECAYSRGKMEYKTWYGDLLK